MMHRSNDVILKNESSNCSESDAFCSSRWHVSSSFLLHFSFVVHFPPISVKVLNDYDCITLQIYYQVRKYTSYEKFKGLFGTITSFFSAKTTRASPNHNHRNHRKNSFLKSNYTLLKLMAMRIES